MFSNNPIPYRSRKGDTSGKFPKNKKAYTDHTNVVMKSGRKAASIIWKWMSNYNLDGSRGFTMMHQHSYIRELRKGNAHMDWDSAPEWRQRTDAADCEGCEDFQRMEDKVYQYALDAPIQMLVSVNPDQPPSDILSVLDTVPRSNKLKRYQRKLFPDDPQADFKMQVVLEQLQGELRYVLRKDGFHLGNYDGYPLSGTLRLNKSNYTSVFYRVYPIYLQGVKPLIPWLSGHNFP